MSKNWRASLSLEKIVPPALILAAFFSLWLAFPAKIECSYDGTGHIAQAWFYKHSLQSYLRVPWTNLWAGSSFLVLHPPFFYALVALVSFLINQIAATKIVMFLSYIMAFFSAYLLAREYGLDNGKGVLAGIIYAFSAWHLFSTFFRAAYPDAFGYALFPLPFLYIKRGLDKNLVPFVVSSALLTLSHQAMMMYALPAIALYYWLLPGRKTERVPPSPFLPRSCFSFSCPCCCSPLKPDTWPEVALGSRSTAASHFP